MKNALRWIDYYLSKESNSINSLGRHEVDNFIGLLTTALTKERNIFVIGNGGSASNASHFATDLGKGASDALEKEGLNRFHVLSLTDNVSWITALGNDYSFDRIFTDQLKSIAIPGDVLIGISVSGTSPNLMHAFKFANSLGMTTVALTGLKKNKENIGTLSDLWVESKDTHYGVVEDSQMVILHAICYYFMENAKEVARILKEEL